MLNISKKTDKKNSCRNCAFGLSYKKQFSKDKKCSRHEKLIKNAEKEICSEWVISK